MVTKEFLGDKYKVHIADNLYSYAHLDSTIVPVREGLVVYNASRVTPDNEPRDVLSHGQKSGSIVLPRGATLWITLGC